MLRKLDWEVATVYEHPPLDLEKDDSQILSWATRHGLILITYDKLRGDAHLRIGRELRRNGGHLIGIGGSPSQPPERSVGKLLFHHDKWSAFFADSEGKVNLHNLQNYKPIKRDDMIEESVALLNDKQFEAYLEKRMKAKTKPIKKRARKIPSEQYSLPSGAA